MNTVYIETTIPSYLTARPTSNPQRQAHQEFTRLWWANERHKYQLCISAYVWGEAELGDPDAVARRLIALEGIPFLPTLPEADSLAHEIVKLLQLPPKAVTDASHLALVILNKVDYLLTWNCTHLANPQLQRQLIRFCQARALHTPVICTPELLTGADYER